MTTTEWRRFIRKLKAAVPAEQAVRIIRRRIERYPDESAYSLTTSRKALIVIDTNLNEDEQEEALVHEWAHLLAHRAQKRAKSKEGHDRIWGACHARVWRAYVKIKQGETPCLPQPP